MNILIAPDSFKGSLSAQEVAQAIDRGLKRSSNHLQTQLRPMADGGEGSLEALAVAGGEWLSLDLPIAAGFEKNTNMLRLSEDEAVIEVAQCVGIEDLNDDSPDIWNRHSSSIGRQIRYLLDKGIRKFTVALGGSCTSDGGLGLLCELGLQLLDENKNLLEPKPKHFERVTEIIWEPLEVLEPCKFTAMCDVTNPLGGERGACAVFGPQKGLASADVPKLDQQILRIYDMIAKASGRDVQNCEGAGAAGGLGAALLMLGAQLKPGAELLFETLNIQESLEWAELIITGEGRSDLQTLDGKLPMRLAKLGRSYGCSSILLSGSLERSAHPQLNELFDGVFSICDGAIALEDAIQNSETLLENSAESLGRLLTR